MWPRRLIPGRIAPKCLMLTNSASTAAMHPQVVAGAARRRRSFAHGGGRAGNQEREYGLEPLEPEDHRHALCGDRQAGTEPLRADSHRHQSGRLWPGRGARHRRPAVCDGAEEPHRRRESAAHRLSVPEDRAVWRQRAPGRRRVRGGDGAVGHCRQGLQHSRLPDARRQMARFRFASTPTPPNRWTRPNMAGAPKSARRWA